MAFALRLWGINFGLPYVYHADEPNYVLIAQNIFKTGDLNPHAFYYPSLFFYINALAYVPYYLIGKLVGNYSSPTDILAPTMLIMGTGQSLEPSTFLLGRFVTVLFSSITVLLIFYVGLQLTNDERVGLVAAAMMAVSPTSVQLSHYITPDTFVTFFTLLAFYGAVQIFQYGKAAHYILAGIAGGLTASTKYNAVLIMLSLVTAHFLRNGIKGWRDRNLYLALGFSVVAFLVATPFAVFDFHTFSFDLYNISKAYATGHPGMEGDALKWYVVYLLQAEGLVVLLATMEIIHGVLAKDKPLLLVSVFPLVYFAFISSFVIRNDRTILPLIPFIPLLAASWLIHLLNHTQSHARYSHWLVAAVGLVGLICLTISLRQSISNDIRLTTVDSRETARVWIAENLPIGARIAIEAYAPYVDPHRFSVHISGRMIDHPAEWYRSNGIDYLVFSQGMFGRFYREPDKYSAEIARYDVLFRTFEIVKTFTDGGYEIRIYRVTKP